MAKKSMIARDVKRSATVVRFAEKRATLKAKVKDPNLNFDEKQAAIQALQKLPRNASPSRMRNRCNLTGRPRGYYRKFGLCRNKLREVIMQGAAPGVVKASW
ncbi:MAG TPA: 30S ribosomal protein S14 [Acidiferrobacteraceae bacterium]|nr:30S ribosomal protein S14 [Acidiferrobacteraceae bacterium]